ncbi:MAG: hypothetical protein R2851_28030 [Caldilineaceae bacterium]
MLSLACTPANMLFGWRKALTVRKSLGLWAFTYAALHARLHRPGLRPGLAFHLAGCAAGETSTSSWA